MLNEGVGKINKLSRAEELDFHMLEGAFYNDVCYTERYIIAYNDKAVDQYSNFCGRIRTTKEEARKVLDEVKEFFWDHDRKPSILLSPFSQPADFSELLADNGFISNYRDVWMFFRGSNSLFIDSSVSIKTVDGPEALKVFVDTFNQAYSGTDPNEPYGQAPPEWGETFYSGYGLEKPGRKIDYFILYFDEKPASILMTSYMDEFGGIYGVGTVPDMRGKGLASTLTLYAVNQLRNHGAREIFLQTEKGSLNEKLYKKLGFATQWETESWTKD